MPGVEVFHAGTTYADDGITVQTSGGRVLAVTAIGPNLKDVLANAYAAIDLIKFEGAQYRMDIAQQALDADVDADESGGMTYADAGVDITAGDALVARIKPVCKATKRTGCDAAIGGFGGVFDLKAAGFKDPILISGTDGVGTKLEVAKQVFVISVV